MTNKDMGILDLILIIAKHRILVITICVLAAIWSITYALLAPMYWKSNATLKPVSETDGIGFFGSGLLEMIGENSFMATEVLKTLAGSETLLKRLK
jgi:LPS O-antigen subunit length determinant protein (WzzB/FepE family)